jgi:carboxyl-terminal processing protease
MAFRAPLGPTLAVIVLSAVALHAEQTAPISGTVAATVTAPLETFDAAWRVLRNNYVAEMAARVDWDALRAELRPRAEKATTDEEARALIREMIARIGQSHFAILPAPIASAMNGPALQPSDVGSLGFDVRLVGPDLLVTHIDADGPAARAGVRPGWALTRVGPRVVRDALGAIGPGPDHVRAFQAWALGTALLRGRTGEDADLEFTDADNRARPRNVMREAERGEPVKLGHLPLLFARLDSRRIQRGGRAVGLIQFNVWMTPVSRQFDEAMDHLRDTDGIVIDLRGNPGGVLTMVMGLSGHFVKVPIDLGVIRTRDAELKLVANPRLVGVSGQPVAPFAGPVAILVDSGSYSASEIFSGGMQAIGRARVFGSRTAGGALPAVLERLPGGDVLQYAIGDFVAADGRRIEGSGVVPDFPVATDRASLLAGRDPVLDAAVDWIAKGPQTP